MINEIKKRPLLWDITHKKYKRPDLKKQHFDEIAALLGPNITGDAVMSRFANMRTNFARNHKRVQDSKRSGKGTDDVYTPTWPLYGSLSFLEKSCIQTDSSSNLESEIANSEDVAREFANQIAGNVYFDETLQAWRTIPADTGVQSDGVSAEAGLQNLAQAPSTSDQVPVPTPTTTIPSSDSESDEYMPAPRSNSAPNLNTPSTSGNSPFDKRGAAKRASSAVMEKAANAMMKLAEQDLRALVPTTVPQISPPPARDHYDHFGQYVAGCLRMMAPERSSMCQVEIAKILHAPQ